MLGEKPYVEHLFGCAAYAHVTKDEQKKFNSKSMKCVLLSYGTETKGYQFYDRKCAEVFYSRDVIFNESSRGIEVPSEETKNITPYVELDSLPDESDKQPVTN